ncbi:MAG: helix-turn-helix domain-containing protein, partial [Oscillospiraceae bacterium]|nr:helix-turn-helix domain-containing protein [Oscillospiraceae bacterium]
MPKTKYLQSREEKRAEMLDKRTLNLKGDLNGVVAKIRAKYGLTQEEFASETGIGRGTLSNRLKNPGSLSL